MTRNDWLIVGILVAVIAILIVLKKGKKRLSEDEARAIVIQIKFTPPKIDTTFNPPLVTPNINKIQELVDKLEKGGWKYDPKADKLTPIKK